jgi:hypothetical protein
MVPPVGIANLTSNRDESHTTNTPSLPTLIYAGATGHFFKVQHDLENITVAMTAITASSPYDATINISHTGILLIHYLTSTARRAHIFSDIQFHFLLSIGKLFDHGCIAIFTALHVTVLLNDIPVLTGNLSTANGGLWTLDP